MKIYQAKKVFSTIVFFLFLFEKKCKNFFSLYNSVSNWNESNLQFMYKYKTETKTLLFNKIPEILSLFFFVVRLVFPSSQSINYII